MITGDQFKSRALPQKNLIHDLYSVVIYASLRPLLVTRVTNKGRKDAYMDKIAFPDPCVGPQMRFLQ